MAARIRSALLLLVTEVLAVLPDIFGPGRSGEMTYYETPAGARVFAAGSINFGGSSLWPTTSRLLENLWARLVPEERS